MSNTGTVTAIGKSRTGKPTVTIDGQIYSAAQVDLGGLRAGDKISFDSASGDYNGVTVWFLNKWTLIEAERKYPPSQTLLPPGSTASELVSLAKQYVSTQSSGVQDAERPCVSNWGAELIKAGLVKRPDDLSAWVEAIKSALR